MERGKTILRGYSWQDFGGAKRWAELPVAAEALARTVGDFGITAGHWASFLAETERRLNGALATRYAGAQVTLTATGQTGYQIGSKYPSTTDEAGLQRFLESEMENATAGFYRARRIRYSPGGGLIPDHSALVRDAAPAIEPVARALSGAGQEIWSDRKKALGLLVSFMHSLRYRVIPETRADGALTTGLLTPLEVLVSGEADCDSRSVLFAGLWKALFTEPILFVFQPEHMLVAVGGPFVACGDWHLRFEGDRYLLCEVTVTGGLLPPGQMPTERAGVPFEHVERVS